MVSKEKLDSMGMWAPLYFATPAGVIEITNELIFGKAEEEKKPEKPVMPEAVNPYAAWQEQVLAQKTASQKVGWGGSLSHADGKATLFF